MSNDTWSRRPIHSPDEATADEAVFVQGPGGAYPAGALFAGPRVTWYPWWTFYVRPQPPPGPNLPPAAYNVQQWSPGVPWVDGWPNLRSA